MRLPFTLVAALTFAFAAGLSLIAAGFASSYVEETSEIIIREALDEAGHDWAEVEADGLQVSLTGIAPDEATRFNALSVVGEQIDASRVIDGMTVAPTADIAPPRFSVEILRNDSGISIIGLIPAATDRTALVERLSRISDGVEVTDLLETANHPRPDGWEDAMAYALLALSRLPQSKVSASAGVVRVRAISDSPEARRQLENELTRAAPPSLRIGLDISAPRPVITPFTLRFLIDEEGARFDACSAQDEKGRDRILAAARSAGLEGAASCTIGLGVPSPNWARAAELSIAALAELGQGSVTISDADISLIAIEGTPEGEFDTVVGELDNALPDVFVLTAVLPEPEDAVQGPAEFTATVSPEGQVQLRGRLGDEALRQVADSYAKAAFGSTSVHTAVRLVEGLPADWPTRVLAGLEALSFLRNGALIVTPERVDLRGVSTVEDVNARISRLLSEQLGSGAEYDLAVEYLPPPEPEDTPPDPEVCEARLVEIQEAEKIAFEPGKAAVAAGSAQVLNQIADILRNCGQIRMEIQGHTDSQGREEMNQQLSQARAQSVLNELRARRVLTSTYAAVGYGESQPIADNDTEEGREANRRIEFRLVRPEPIEETQTALEEAEAPAQEDGDAADAPAEEEGGEN
ncbi:OmpA family protein [Lutimaribacter marinistellae]|uniref:OmpA family protein n=1 Tax=Lutimaribacter marinistellae TaxID=1820329 RepID=A0ABV7TIB5_9RHOB